MWTIFRAKLLTSLRTEQLYRNILISDVWSDRNRGSFKKPDYVFGGRSDYKEHHSTEHITSFVDTTVETITVSTEHTYRRGSSALALETTTAARDDSKIAWGTGERTFKTGIFQYNAPGFQESAIAKFDMLASCGTVLSVGCNVP